MQKAHLYEAILLVNRGIDEAVRGLERLRRSKEAGLNAAYFDEKLTLLEMHRALVNGFFCNKLQRSEESDEDRFEELHREYEKKGLNEVQVYRDVALLEQRRWTEEKGPRVRFLTEQEQRAYERPAYPLPPTEGRKSAESEQTRG
jgi:hypothetical protein